MIHSIYIDNFKGFRDTIIPFGNVNFLVGDNSTGKTTVINLVRLLDSISFWNDVDILTNSNEVVPFKEFVNQYSDDQSYFSIGIDSDWDEDKSRVYFLLTFKEDPETLLSQLKSFKFTTGDNTVFVENESKGSHVYVKKYRNQAFAFWLKDKKGFKKNKDLEHFVDGENRTPFIVMVNYIINYLSGANDIFTPEIMIPVSSGNEWIAPVRASAKKYYHSEESLYKEDGSHIPHMIKSIFDQDRPLRNNILRIIRDFGKDSGLFDDIKIEKYGKKDYAPFSINIIYNKIPINLSRVGFGVNQILPLLLESLYYRKYLLSYQQPELHLHPKAQAAFGNVIYFSSLVMGNNYLIETHSDFLINRYRYMMHIREDAEEKPDHDARILFFERSAEGLSVSSIVFDKNGKYPENMPESYGKFFIDEQFNMLSV